MRNWTINEAVKVINEGTDLEAIKEIASHFPVFAMAAAKNDLAGVAVLMGEKFTLNRLSKEPINVNVNDNKEAATETDKPLEEMTTKELMKLCDARGIKVPHYGKNKQFYLEQLQGAGDTEDVVDLEEGEWSEEEDQADQADPYEGKTAKELHAMCKERGIKADIKKPAKFYADLLRKADAEEAESDDGEGEDDWGEETPDEKATKKAKNGKAAGKGGKSKTTSKPAAADADADDDEDWDI